MLEETTLARSSGQLTWAAAERAWQDQEGTVYPAALREYEAKGAEAERECPDRWHEFAPFGLTPHHDGDRDRLLMRAEMSIVLREHKGRKDAFTPEELGAIRERAARAVDGFTDYRKQRRAVFESIVKKAEAAHDMAVDARSEARDRLLGTPAPDIAALAVKIELLSWIMTEADADDAQRIVQVRDDARRLLLGIA